MDQALKVRENKVRRAAERRGWTLEKSKRRDPNALEYGRYILTNEKQEPVLGVFPMPFSASLDDVEKALGITRTSR